MVLPDAENVQADLVGKLDLLEQVAHPLGSPQLGAGHRVHAGLGEGIDADFHGL